MAETVVRSGDNFLDIRTQSVVLQAESLRQSVWIKMMAGKQPKQRAALAKRERLQSSPDMPVVMITDLETGPGDTVTCDMFKTVSGIPFMGDEKMQGQGAPLRFSSMEVKINQSRFPIDAGGKMTNKRTRHNLRKIARSNMSSYFARLNDEVLGYHAAGTRGSHYTDDMNVPLDTHPKFAKVMINPVKAPTRNRRFIAGGHQSIADITNADALKLEDLDLLSTILKESPFPPAPIRVEKDPMGDEQKIWCLMVSQRQWLYILWRAGVNSQNWRKFVSEAARRAMISKHPLFQGDAGLWNGILVKVMDKPIRLDAGFMLKETQADGTESDVQVPAGLPCDRAVLLGGQSVAVASGNAGNKRSPFPMGWNEELTDHKNALEIAAWQMNGVAKFRYEGTDGQITDFGCAVIDSYAPDPASDAGRRLRTALQM